MSDVIIVGLLSLAGTVVGSMLGILASNRLTVYRIEQLEKKVDKHNTIIERTAVVERDMKTAYKRIDELRDEFRKENSR